MVQKIEDIQKQIDMFLSVSMEKLNSFNKQPNEDCLEIYRFVSNYEKGMTALKEKLRQAENA